MIILPLTENVIKLLTPLFADLQQKTEKLISSLPLLILKGLPERLVSTKN